MNTTSTAVSVSVKNEWIARDGNKWVVAVPVAGGRKDFPFDQYNGSHKALMNAKAFHDQMEKKHRDMLEYLKKHGERPSSVRSDNNTGVRGITRKVFPCLTGRANIVFLAYFTCRHRGIYESQSFSTAKYITEEKAFTAAKKQRKKWEREYGK